MGAVCGCGLASHTVLQFLVTAVAAVHIGKVVHVIPFLYTSRSSCVLCGLQSSRFFYNDYWVAQLVQ